MMAFAMTGSLSAVPVHAAGLDKCAALRGLAIPASGIGLPTSGAVIETSKSSAASADQPAMCVLNGRIDAADAAGLPIHFEVNLPEHWNGKAIQLGGGGFDGALVTGLDNIPGTGDGPLAPARPIVRGYVTFGSDGGHQGNALFDASFGRNETALRNYLGESVKKVRDVAARVVKQFDGHAPRYTYFAGGSKGGQEALVAAQRYGKDYDGIIAYYPAKDMAALSLGWARMVHAAYGAGGSALSEQKQVVVAQRALDACDALDGLKDGVIANVAACQASFTPLNLQCESKTSGTSQCLTPGEVATLKSATEAYVAPYLLANGQSNIGPFPALLGGMIGRLWMAPQGPAATAYGSFIAGVGNNFWPGAATIAPANLDPEVVKQQFTKFSEAGDATSVELDDFLGHGGKIILVQGSADMLVPAAHTTAYYLRLKARHAQARTDFVRYFIQPGYGHGMGDFNISYDALTALDNWVDGGRAPTNQVARDANAAGNNRKMPLCEYPAFPRYVGGDTKSAESFVCATD